MKTGKVPGYGDIDIFEEKFTKDRNLDIRYGTKIAKADNCKLTFKIVKIKNINGDDKEYVEIGFLKNTVGVLDERFDQLEKMTMEFYRLYIFHLEFRLPWYQPSGRRPKEVSFQEYLRFAKESSYIGSPGKPGVYLRIKDLKNTSNLRALKPKLKTPTKQKNHPWEAV